MRQTVKIGFPALAMCVVLAGLRTGASAQEAAGSMAFNHFHKGEQVGITVLTLKNGARTIEERTLLDRQLSSHPLGTYTAATTTFNRRNQVTGYALATVSRGLYGEREAALTWPAEADTEARPMMKRTVHSGVDRPSTTKVPLFKSLRLLVLDLNHLGPLTRFTLHRAWRPDFNALSQTSRIQVLLEGAPGVLEAREAHWLKRTSRERLPVEGQVVGCSVFALHIESRVILFSVSSKGGDLMKIEEPARGYEIRRTFTPPPMPRPRGTAVVEAFDRLTRLTSHRTLGLSLRDRHHLEAVTYVLDIPCAGTTRPQRPWQSFTGTLEAGRLQGTLTVTAARPARDPALEEASPEKKTQQAAEKPPPEIRALAARLRAGAAGDEAYVEAVGRYCAGHLGFVFNIQDPCRALETGFGSVKAKAGLAEGLIRAQGLPLRIATGLVYTGKAFVPHRWVEAWVAAARRWMAVDPTLGETGGLSPLHLTLGTPWTPPAGGEKFSVRVDGIRFKAGKAGKRDRIRWPNGEKRVYALYKKMATGNEKLFGYLDSTPRWEGEEEIRFETNLILDWSRIGGNGYFNGKASSIFDAFGHPRWFNLQTWSGGKRYTFVTRIKGLVAVIQQTDAPTARVKMKPESFLAFNILYNHWAVFFTGLDPTLEKRMTVSVLRPKKARLYTYTLIRRGQEKVRVEALGKEVEAHIFDLVERNLRFWVTDSRVLVKILDRESGILCLLGEESLREKF